MMKVFEILAFFWSVVLLSLGFIEDSKMYIYGGCLAFMSIIIVEMLIFIINCF